MSKGRKGNGREGARWGRESKSEKGQGKGKGASERRKVNGTLEGQEGGRKGKGREGRVRTKKK